MNDPKLALRHQRSKIANMHDLYNLLQRPKFSSVSLICNEPFRIPNLTSNFFKVATDKILQMFH